MGEDLENESAVLEIEVLPGEEGMRLDRFLAERVPEASRTYLKRLIARGCVRGPHGSNAPSRKVRPGDVYRVIFPEPEPSDIEPEPIPLDVMHEDEDIVVVNKPPFMIVHPAPGQVRGTLVGALLYRYGSLSGVQGDTRPGIIHRLDKDTSGVMVVARNDRAHRALARQFKERTVSKVYLAVVHGRPPRAEGEIGRPIGKSIRQVGKMAVDGIDAKTAHTIYEVIDSVGAFSLVRCRILTGRTHQIRLHMAHIGCPLACDALYGREAVLAASDVGAACGQERVLLKRQALHSHRLTIRHPSSNIEMTFEVPMPEDMAGFLNFLREVHR